MGGPGSGSRAYGKGFGDGYAARDAELASQSSGRSKLVLAIVIPAAAYAISVAAAPVGRWARAKWTDWRNRRGRDDGDEPED